MESTRIVGGDLTSGTLQVLAFPDGTLPQNTSTFIVNGAPFSGTGFGFDATGTALNATFNATTQTWSLVGTNPVALLPNLPLSVYAAGNPPGGANSDYTAADFQHTFLAAQVPDATAPGGIRTLPSFHRPALIKYWENDQGVTTFRDLWAASPASHGLCRAIMMRPIGMGLPRTDHPNFTGSNPSVTPTTPWEPDDPLDVDNDGDGRPDSVWVDLGMPVRATSDGRLYKPLFAILCVDLDGRLNLNAQGNLEQTNPARYDNTPGPSLGKPNSVNVTTDSLGAGASNLLFAGGLATAQLPRGQGYGPAEITLAPLFYSLTDYRQLMVGINTATVKVDGRYADLTLGSNPLPGELNVVNALSRNKWQQYDNLTFPATWNWWEFQTGSNLLDAYGAPPDTFGIGAVGLDVAGRPLYVSMGGTTVNNPYELNLGAKAERGLASPTTASDNPFSPAELERLLRPYDRDATSLPDRLAKLAPGLSGTLKGRLSATTESWDVPGPNVPTTKRIAELLNDRGIPTSAWSDLVPPELLAGLKMNINRPFGNGRDDNGNSVVDEPELETGETVSLYNTATGTVSANVSYDPTGAAANSLVARQLEARYLYVLACLTSDLAGLNTQLGGVDATAKYLAQWAVNVVDFEDRDSIMTPFDYDPAFANPAATITAWNVTPGTSPRVWGCERPELLISETLAFHDRRTEDTADDKSPEAETGDVQTKGGLTTDNLDPDKKDASFDQRFRPEGSLFVELYNPWTDEEPEPMELCRKTPTGEVGVDLTKTSGPDSPVWRLIIVHPRSGKDPDDPDNPVAIERAVYFVGPTDCPTLPSGGNVKFHPAEDSSTNRPVIAPILPGRYAVIGPGDTNDLLSSTTYLGFKTGENPAAPSTGTRRIELRPSTNPAVTGQVAVYNDGSSNDLSALPIKAPTAIIINKPLRLNISEPDGGYGSLGFTDSTSLMSPALDIPADEKIGNPTTKVYIQQNRRVNNVKVLHLQRLANPLKPYNNTAADPDYNPYRTVDTMAIDLTSFNGVSDATDPHAGTTKMEDIEFYAHQRGQNNNGAANNVWKQESIPSAGPKANTPEPAPKQATTSIRR